MMTKKLTEMQSSSSDHYQSAKSILDTKTIRSLYFDQQWHSEIPWSILIDLYLADKEGRDVNVTQACYGTGGPPTTALRYVALMEQSRLISRRDGTGDNRMSFLSITPAADLLMMRWMERVANNSARLGFSS